MDVEKQNTIRDRYNDSASVYDARYGEIQREKFQLSLTTPIWPQLSSGLILDLGGGTGLFQRFLQKNLQEFPPNVVVIDISGEMLKIAHAAGISFLIEADIGKCPIRQGIFSAAVSYTAFQNLPNWKDGVDSLLEVLAPGGAYVVSILKKGVAEQDFFACLEKNMQTCTPVETSSQEDYIAYGLR